jgi:hypothetical protein
MKTFRVCLMALAATGGFSASAQSPPTFETKATALSVSCMSAGNQTPEEASGAIAACEKLIVDLNALRQSNPALGGHDLNVFLLVKAMGEAAVASSYGKIDGVRSARVCDRTERGWMSVSQIKKAESPAYAVMVDQLVASSVGAITKCRQEFGTPAGATPLPAG